MEPREEKYTAQSWERPKALALAKELIQQCDVVIENFATGVMEDMGLGYEELKKLKPDLIMVSISGYGHTGPLKDYMGYGPAIPPLTGLSALTGYQGGPPQELGVSIGDPNAGISARRLSAPRLLRANVPGQGQYIDVALWGAAAVLAAEGWMEYAMNGVEPPRQGNRDIWMAPHNCFRCRGEDTWVTIACGTEEEWQALCRAMGQPHLADDPRFRTASDRKAHEDELERLITAWTDTTRPLGDHTNVTGGRCCRVPFDEQQRYRGGCAAQRAWVFCATPASGSWDANAHRDSVDFDQRA